MFIGEASANASAIQVQEIGQLYSLRFHLILHRHRSFEPGFTVQSKEYENGLLWISLAIHCHSNFCCSATAFIFL